MNRSRIFRTLTLGAVLCAVACSEPVLDSNDLEASAARVRAALEESRRARFDEALALVREARQGRVPGTAEVRLDGLTGAQLLAEAERIEIRREIAAIEDDIAFHEDVLAETERLAQLEIAPTRLVAPDGEPARIEARLTNGTGRALASGFVRLGVEAGEGRLVYKTEEYVAFQPPLKATEAREVEIQVSRDFARLFLSTPQAQLTAGFTSFEGGTDFVVQEPSRDRVERAERELRAARDELEKLKTKLDSL